MKIKLGATITGLKIQMRRVMMIADYVWKDFGQECVITSGTETTEFNNLEDENPLIHSPGSLHPFGYALDFRTRYFSELDKQRVAAKLSAKLEEISPQYRVITEKTHIHVEYRGFIYG
jgi:hypothetical protein